MIRKASTCKGACRIGESEMSLKLHYHPLASFCHKALIALYENGTPFEPVIVDLGDPESSAKFRALWPMAKMPVLEDTARGRIVPESTIVVEYLDRFYPGPTRLVPEEPDLAWQTRLWDRFYDCYVQDPMQKIVLDGCGPKATGTNTASNRRRNRSALPMTCSKAR